MLFLAVTLPVLAALFILSAFFSSSETVLFSLSPLQIKRLRGDNPYVGSKVAEWTADPSRVLSTILAGNNLVNFSIASLGYTVLVRFLPPTLSAGVSVAVFTVMVLVFGEILPKQYALRNAERLAPLCVRMLSFWMIVLKPFASVMMAGGNVFRHLLHRERRALSDGEFRAVVEAAAAGGVLDREEASMVKGVMRLTDLYALNEMTPRVKLVGIEVSEDEATRRRAAERSPYPYLPVYRRDMDHIEGFLDVESYLEDGNGRSSAHISEPMTVSEHESLDDLLVKFVRSGKRIAQVLDRWGGTAGVITHGDVLELVVEGVEETADGERVRRVGSREATGRARP